MLQEDAADRGRGMDDVTLAALLSSRLCHDLSGPVGAIGNGVEMLEGEDDPEMRRQVIELMAFSAGEARRRLEFYRLAYGAPGGLGAAVPLAEARRAARHYFETHKAELDWPEAAEEGSPELPPEAVRLLLNLVLLGGEALARGGSVAVRLAFAAGSFSLALEASGPGAALDAAEAAALLGQVVPEALDSRSVQPYFAARLAAGLGCEVEIAADQPDRIVLRAAFPL
jgi:histidine phosphotransferase ChpT